MIITLKRDAICKTCGTPLSKGTRAHWYKSGAVYGLDCHKAPGQRPENYYDNYRFDDPLDRQEPIGQTLSRYDRYGVFLGDGTRIGSTCRCEDYPCCGH